MRAKRLISAVISAAMAVSAAAMIIPSASAETASNGALAKSIVTANFETKYTSNVWSPTSTLTGEGYDQNYKKINAKISDDGVLTLDSQLSAITKGGQNLYGDFTIQFDATFPVNADNKKDGFGLKLVNTVNGVSAAETEVIGVASGGGAVKYNGSTVSVGGTPYVATDTKYTFTLKFTNGKMYFTVSGAKFTNGNLSIENLAADLPAGYEKTTSLKFQNYTNSAGVKLDNISVMIDAAKFTADNITDGKYIANDANSIKIATNKYFPAANTENAITMTRNGEAFTDYTVAWEDSVLPAGYKVNPTVTFNDSPAGGTYTLSITVADVNSRTSKPSWEFEVVAVDNFFNGFEDDSITVDKANGKISEFVPGRPSSEFVPVWAEGKSGTAVITDCFGNTVTDGAVYDGYTYTVTNTQGDSFTYTFDAADIYSNNFNTAPALSDGNSVINVNNRGQRDKLFPAADAESTAVSKKPVNDKKEEVTAWNQTLFQNIAIEDDTNNPKLSVTKGSAPLKSDRAIVLRADDYTGTGNIQIIKDFYTKSYPVQISMSVRPDGNGDVSMGVKTSYYGESIVTNGSSDGSGVNYLATPIWFGADGNMMSFGKAVGRYAANEWYDVSLVLDVKGGRKTAVIYVNGEQIGSVYDWSNIASTLGNNDFYSVTMRENYKCTDAVTSETYFDNLSITRLYSIKSAPNGYTYAPEGSVFDRNVSGFIRTADGASADFVNGVAVPNGISKYVVNAAGEAVDTFTADGSCSLVLANSERVRSYSLSAVSGYTILNSDNQPVDAKDMTTGKYTVSFAGMYDGDVVIVAEKNADGTIAWVDFRTVADEKCEINIDYTEGQTVVPYVWNSIGGMVPTIKVN